MFIVRARTMIVAWVLSSMPRRGILKDKFCLPATLMSRAKTLKRAFDIDNSACLFRRVRLSVIANMTGFEVIQTIPNYS